MASVGYATLEVIPSLRGFRSKLEQGTGASLASAGRAGGKKYGDTAGREAASSFKRRFSDGAKSLAAPLAGVAIGAGAVSFFKDAFAEAKEAGQVSRVTAKLIESTGAAAHVSASQVGDLANRLSDYAAVDDELVQSGENVLLTFKNVRNEVGKGNAIFDRGAKAALDMSAVLGTDMKAATLQLGKALNDPIKGITSLGRAGVQFTAQQKEQIKALVASGDLLSAQKVILTEVEGQVGGAAGAAADGTERLKVAFANLKESVGTQLMPAVEGFSNWAVDEGIPALGEAGGAVKDFAKGFADLPGPVKVATGAFVALRLAAAAGLTTSLASGVASVGSAMTGLRIRAMLAADAFAAASGGATRMAGSLAAVRAASVGAGAGMMSGLKGALSMVGGAWGAAFIVGTATVLHFWSEHKKAVARVDELTASLDKQTGAVTKLSREQVFNTLQQNGTIAAAKKLGLNLDTLRSAALGNKGAQELLNLQLDEYIAKVQALKPAGREGVTTQDQMVSAANRVRDALGAQNGELDQSRTKWQDQAEFMGKGATAADDTTEANKGAADSFKSLSERIADTKDKIEKLAKAEQARRLSNLKNRQDKLALIEQMQATAAEASNATEVGDINKQIKDAKDSGAKERADLRKQIADSGSQVNDLQKRLAAAKTPSERASIRSQIGDASKSATEARAEFNARITESTNDQTAAVAELTAKLDEYRKTLNPTTKAGQENLKSLYDLAGQWNNSSGAVRNAKGAYAEIRQSFIVSAMEMGKTRKGAETLADKILLVPKRKRIDITTPGMDKALADLKALRERVKSANQLAVRVNTKQGNDPRLRGFATGGKVGGTGYGDKQLILADSREWVMNPSASAYYGDAFMSALNRMQVPKFAAGGPVSQSAPSVRAGSTYHVTVVADDPWKWKRDMDHMQRTESMGAESFR